MDFMAIAVDFIESVRLSIHTFNSFYGMGCINIKKVNTDSMDSPPVQLNILVKRVYFWDETS